MSALGQERTCAVQNGMSALCHKRHRTLGFEMDEAANRGSLANLKVFTLSVRQFDGPLRPRCGMLRTRRPGDWLVLNQPACPPYCPHDPDQQDRADEPGNQVADPSS